MNHQPFGPGAMNPLSLCQGDESSLVMFKIKQNRNIQSGELTKMYKLCDNFPLFLYAGAMNPLSLFKCVPGLRKMNTAVSNISTISETRQTNGLTAVY